jgi:hypothetical protein
MLIFWCSHTLSVCVYALDYYLVIVNGFSLKAFYNTILNYSLGALLIDRVNCEIFETLVDM